MDKITITNEYKLFVYPVIPYPGFTYKAETYSYFSLELVRNKINLLPNNVSFYEIQIVMTTKDNKKNSIISIDKTILERISLRNMF